MLGNAIQGSVRPSQEITWLREDGIAEDLSGATLTGKIHSRKTNETRDIAGNLLVTDGTNGVFRWDYAQDDVEQAGQFQVQFTAVFADNPTPAKTKISQWIVGESL